MPGPLFDITRLPPPPPPPERVYRVPTRFGIGSIICLTALFCVLFGILRYYHAPPASYAVAIAYFFAVGGAQMLWGGEFPRQVSIGAGAILFPIAMLILLWGDDDRGISWRGTGLVLFVSIFIGAFFGYLAGALLAGFFLVSEMIDQRLGLAARRDATVDVEVIETPEAVRSAHVAAFVERRQQERGEEASRAGEKKGQA